MFQLLGWGAAAAATPAVMLCAGGAFFGLSLAANQGISIAGMNPASMAIAGAVAGAVTQASVLDRWASCSAVLGGVLLLRFLQMLRGS